MGSTAASFGQINGVIQNLVKALIPLAAIACVVMIVMGGINYLSAGGDKEGTAKAQRTLTFAFSGFLLTVSAWLILSLVGRFLGIEALISTFSICLPGQSC